MLNKCDALARACLFVRQKVGGELFITGTNPSRSAGVRWGGASHGLGGATGRGYQRREGRGVVRSTAGVVVVSGVEGA